MNFIHFKNSKELKSKITTDQRPSTQAWKRPLGLYSKSMDSFSREKQAELSGS